MKRWAGVMVAVMLVACGSDPPPAAVMVPAPSESPSPAPPPPASPPPTPSAEPVASAVPEPAPTGSAHAAMWGADVGPPDPLASGKPAPASSGKAHAPSLRQGVVMVNGKLPTEVIQRIIRQNFGRFRLCYENGLRTNSTLAGRVSVKLTIDAKGGVMNATDGGSDLPDKSVIACVVKGISNLSFPAPEGGVVNVTYPIIFAP